MKPCWSKFSIGKKFLMAITGLFLFAFVVAHMLGNLQIFMGQEALNSYAEHLEDMPYLLWPARIFLLITLIVHVFTAILLSFENRVARPQGYASQATIQASYASRTMMLSGVIIFAFIVYHLLHFTFGLTNPGYYDLTDAKGRHDVFTMVVFSFQDLPISAIYVIAMALLCFHLSHGVQSLFQSLGFESARGFMKKTARAAALLIFIGNSSIPVAIYFGIIQLPKGMMQ